MRVDSRRMGVCDRLSNQAAGFRPLRGSGERRQLQDRQERGRLGPDARESVELDWAVPPPKHEMRFAMGFDSAPARLVGCWPHCTEVATAKVNLLSSSLTPFHFHVVAAPKGGQKNSRI